MFLEGSANTCVKHCVCAVCARETPMAELEDIVLEKISGNDLLIPISPHPAQTLTKGILLVHDSVHYRNGIECVNVCLGCRCDLDGACRPSLSLANGMWIGSIPEELQKLSIAEVILILLVYIRCYIFKLYPKTYIGSDPSVLQQGMVGNVTTYKLNTKDIIDMLRGKKMPRPMKILSSVIMVTYIGTTKLPKTWLKSTFRVRRRVVLDAL